MDCLHEKLAFLLPSYIVDQSRHEVCFVLRRPLLNHPAAAALPPLHPILSDILLPVQRQQRRQQQQQHKSLATEPQDKNAVFVEGVDVSFFEGVDIPRPHSLPPATPSPIDDRSVRQRSNPDSDTTPGTKGTDPQMENTPNSVEDESLPVGVEDDGVRKALAPGEAGFCDLLAGYFLYVADTFCHATQVHTSLSARLVGCLHAFEACCFIARRRLPRVCPGAVLSDER